MKDALKHLTRRNTALDRDTISHHEAIFHNANGYIGVRYDFEEGYPDGYGIVRSQYINGFYDYAPMPQAERLFGLPERKQVMLNVANTQEIRLFLDGELFSMYNGTVRDWKLVLDMENGTTIREVEWVSPKGKEARIRVVRMASYAQLPLFLIEYQVLPRNFSGEIILESVHDGNVCNYADPEDPRAPCAICTYLRPMGCELKDGATYILSRTSQSGLEVCSAVRNVLSQACQTEFLVQDNRAVSLMKTNCDAGRPLTLTKYAVFCDSLRYPDCAIQAELELDAAVDLTARELHRKQAGYLRNYWQNCLVEIAGNEELAQAVVFNQYHLYQSVGKDTYSNIGPKGLSGDGYEGQYFWDSEVYVQPFFTMTNPRTTRMLLESRYMQLPHARENAALLGHCKGALYPWRTITGEECSGYFPAGSAQYHINGALGYSIISYYLATKDIEFIADKGAEILFETARLWLDVGTYFRGEFHINKVTGPDEYTCIVNNNFYTNLLAQYHLRWAVKFYMLLKEAGLLEPVASRIRLRKSEIRAFIKAAETMHLPYDRLLDIHPQDDSFIKLKDWDLDSIPPEKFPLLLHYHPLHLYRHKICKQADTVLAYFMLEDGQSEQTMRNSYLYYEKITTHDSSLSLSIFSIMAARLGMEEKAWDYFGNTAQLDLLDLYQNTSDGVHTANMAGSFLTIVFGFGGFRLKEQGIYFAPILPYGWKGYRFKIVYENTRINVSVTEDECIFSRGKGRSKTIHVYGEAYQLKSRLVIPRQKPNQAEGAPGGAPFPGISPEGQGAILRLEKRGASK